ncbi:MAG: hypothetical protein ABIO63_08830, partial [Casimicrobiaceae bacterium]
GGIIQLRDPDMNRRDFLLAGAAAMCNAQEAIAREGTLALQTLGAPESMVQLRANGSGELLTVSGAGVLWRCNLANDNWTRLAEAIDPATPVTGRDGRIAARLKSGGLWVLEAGRATTSTKVALAAHAGLLILPLGIVAVVGVAGSTHAVRLEADGTGQWSEVSRSTDVVMPDARPLQVDLDATGDGEGHIVVLAGPDRKRYTHGVLGDAIESTRVLYLERHGLTVLRSLEVSAPYVIEDIAPRVVAWQGRRALLTMRSGPQGAALAIVAAHPDRRDALVVAAAGPPIGSANRWMSATTDGTHLMAVHTPHIRGVLHEYRGHGAAMQSRVIDHDVSNHRIGSRELDLAAWVDRKVVLPAQNRRSLRCLDANDGWRACGSLTLPSPVTASVPIVKGGQSGVAALLEDGQIIFVEV